MRKLYIVGPITHEAYKAFSMQLDRLLAQDAHAGIDIELSTTGGETVVGLAFYSKIRTCPVKVSINAIGACQSAGTLILAAGDYRTAAAETIFMFHDSNISIEGTVNQLAKEVKELHEEELFWCNLLTKRLRLSVKQLRSMHKRTTYFNAEDALNFGLIDAITASKGG